MRKIIICALLLCSVFAAAQTNKEWRDSLATLTRMIEQNPKSVELRLKKAAVNLELQQWEYAADEYSLVLANDAQNLTALYFRAYAYNNLRRNELAKNDYEEILKQQPRSFDARLGLACTLSILGRNDKALDEMNVLVELHPDSAVAYAARSNVEFELKQYEAALYDKSQAVRLSPTDISYTEEKVSLLLFLKRKDEARAALDEAVKNGTPRGLLKGWYDQTK